jgi:hypothetical protein
VSWPQQPGPQQLGPQLPAPPQQPAPRQPGSGGARPRYPNAVQPRPQQPPPHRVPPRPAGRPRRNRTLILVPAIVVVLAVAGVIAGIIAASGTKHESGSSQPATPTGPPYAAPSGSTAQTRAAIAHNAETVVHGLGNGRPNEFCPLIDRLDLQRLLREKHLLKCADIRLTTRTNRAGYQSFRVTDPSAIQLNGDTADIPATAITPATFGTVEMREDGDGTWKFRFYTG